MLRELSKQHYEAILTGDHEKAAQLKEQIDEQVKLAQRKSTISPSAVNTILGDDNTPVTEVYDFLQGKYGDNWWNWEIETLEHELWSDYGLAMSDNTADKVQALKMLLNNPRPFLDWYYFNQLCLAMCGVGADFTSLRSPSPGMVIATMKSMMAIRPEEQFSRDVKKFACITMLHEGICTPPPSLIGILKEEFEPLVSEETIAMWPDVYRKCADMVDLEEFGDADDPVDIQARRLIVAEHASNKFGA